MVTALTMFWHTSSLGATVVRARRVGTCALYLDQIFGMYAVAGRQHVGRHAVSPD